MNAVVEKVAEAIWSADPITKQNAERHFSPLHPEVVNGYRDMARAAIEALGLTEMVDSIPVADG